MCADQHLVYGICRCRQNDEHLLTDMHEIMQTHTTFSIHYEEHSPDRDVIEVDHHTCVQEIGALVPPEYKVQNHLLLHGAWTCVK